MRNGIGKRLTALLLSGMMILTNSSGVAWAESMEMQVEEAELCSADEFDVMEADEQELLEEEIIEDMVDEPEETSETVSGETEMAEVLTDTENVWGETEEEPLIEEVIPETEEIIEEEVDSKGASSEESEDVVASGSCGTNVTWKLTGTESEGYTLTISGEGEMTTYGTNWSTYYPNTPWIGYREYIKEAIVEDGVTRVGNLAFSCTGVEKATFADSVISIGTGIFDGCTNLVDVKLPAGITVLSGSTFKNCTSLKSIELPSRLKTIGGDAFINCTSLESVKIPDGVIRIEDGAFSLCTSLKSITLPDSVGVIEGEAFDRSGLTSIVIPPGVTYLDPKTFWYCSSLVTVEIPNALTWIGGYDQYTGCFQGCESLTDVYYHGTEAEWSEVYLGNMNNYLAEATFHYLAAEKIPMYSCEITLDAEEYVYAGEAITPVVTVKKSSTVLEEGTNYTITYENNDKIGEATAVITGINDHEGEVRIPFRIIPGKVTNLHGNNEISTEDAAYGGVNRNLEVAWDSLNGVDGYEVWYSKDSNFSTYEEVDIDWGDAEYNSNTLERKSTYYVKVRAYKNFSSEKVYGDWSDVLKVQIGNQIVVSEMWGFGNLKVQIDAGYYYRMFAPEQAKELYLYGKKRCSEYKKFDGVCYGMIMAGISLYDYDIPTDSYGVSSLNDIVSFDSAKDAWSSQLNMDAADAIIFALLAQSYTSLQNNMYTNKNKLVDLKEAIENCQKSNAAPVMIGLIEHGANHVLLATGIEEENIDSIKIAVYDPNYPSDTERYLYLLKTKDIITGWSYEFSDNVYWAGNTSSSFKNNDYILFDVTSAAEMAGILHNGIDTAEDAFEGGQLIRITADKDVFDYIAEWKQNLNYGDPLFFAQSSLETEEEKMSEMYIVNAGTEIVLNDVPAGVTISVASGYHTATVEVTEESDITINVGDTNANQVTVTSDAAVGFIVTFKDTVSLDQPVKETTITGTSNAGTTATIQQTTDQKIQISGATSMQYEREEGVRDTNTGVMQNPAISETPTVELDVSKSYQIEEGEEEPQLAASSNNDGVFDQVIEMIKECSHVYETAIEKAATCSATGMKYEKCTLCGEKKSGSETTIPKKAHTYGSWATVSTATVFQKEKQQRICSACKTKETREYGSVLKPTITVNASTILLRTKQSTTGLKVTGLAAGDSIVSMTLNSSTYVKISNVNLKAGTCKLTALKKKETKGTTKLIIKLKSGLTKEIPIKVQTSAVKTSSIGNVKKTLTMKVKGTVKLSPVLNPFTSQDKIKYSSSNKKIVKVSAKGVLTALKPGTAKITVKAGKKSFSCKVTVEGIKNTGLKNVPSTLTLKVKKTKTLKPVRVPSNSTDTITYKSSNTKVATVSAKGVIKAKKKGTAKITVKCGSATATCTVTVN